MDDASPPQAPDPHKTAAAQYQYNREAALDTASLNRPNQYTPYGQLEWTQAPATRTFNQSKYDAALAAAQQQGGYYQDLGEAGAGAWVGTGGTTLPNREDDQFYDMTPSTQWSSKVTLDPRLQRVLDAQMATSEGLAGATQNALGRVNDLMGQPMDFTQDRQAVEDALYGRYTRTLDPQMQQQEEAMRSHLMNRGFMEGTPAFERELQRFQQNKTDAYGEARRDAVLGGGQEQARQLALRNQVINELASLRSGQQVSTPQFSSGASGAAIAPGNYAQGVQNQFNAQLGAYNADVASNNALMSGLFTVGGAMLGGPMGAALGGMMSKGLASPQFMGGGMVPTSSGSGGFE